ncbi:hypothetical protein L7F22_020318 [Adiantum nelumboides]|nr:hypothetical protein [Adiantum nelumboides]
MATCILLQGLLLRASASEVDKLLVQESSASIRKGGGSALIMDNHTSSAVRVLASASQVPGRDVSSYQGNVNWAAAYGKGARFAYVKATEGTGYVNPYFAQQYNGAYKVGMIRGAYHFARPDKSGGAAQAKYFLAHGGRWSRDGKTLPGALDLEGGCRRLTQRQMAAWISVFISAYHSATGVYPVLYTSASWYNSCVGRHGDFSSTCPLWLACYCSSASSLPFHWSYYTIWQYADHGAFPGDQNVFNGSLKRLRALALG